MYSTNELSQMYLPIGQMLQIHRITSSSNGTIVGEQDITCDDWVFPLHFPGDPIYPGSLLIEGAGQLIAIWGWQHGLRGKPRLVKVTAEFNSPVSSSDKLLTYTGKIVKRNNICIGTVLLNVGERLIGKISATVIVLAE